MQVARVSSLKGSVLVFVLLLTTLMFLLAMAMANQSQGEVKASLGAARAAEARALAFAGLSDARAKLARDLRFPPPGADDQAVYAYSEDVSDLDGGRVIGSYNVTVDRRYEGAPYFMVRLRSEGVLGLRTRAVARSTVVADLDFSAPGSNPDLFQIMRLQVLEAP